MTTTDLIRTEPRRSDACSSAAACPLCMTIAGDGIDPLDEVWGSSGAAVLMPAWGHLTVGHVMVCSREHHTNLANAPRSVSTSVLEYADEVSAVLERSLGIRSFAFEHGFNKPVSPAEDNCSINHVHVHVVPLPEELLREASSWIDHYIAVETRRICEVDREYLLARSGSSAWRISPPGERIFSRHFVKAIDRLLGGEQRWDETVAEPRPLIAQSADLFRS